MQSPPPSLGQTHKKRLVFLSLLGTLIEYYDYALFGFFTPFLARTFFPNPDTLSAFKNTFLVFALGSFAKVFGGFLFGFLGDSKGRIKALRSSIFLMACSTAAIGLIPSYQYIGSMAVVLLVICRILQGFSVGGESNVSLIYAMESSTPKTQYFVNGLFNLTILVGIFSASLSLLLLDFFFSWRIFFLIGGGIGLIFYSLRKYLSLNIDIPKASTQMPLFPMEIFKSYGQELVSAALIFGSIGGLYHYSVIFLPHFLCSYTAIIDQSFYTYCFVVGSCFYGLGAFFSGVLTLKLSHAKMLVLSSFFLLGLLLFQAILLCKEMFIFSLYSLVALFIGFLTALIYPDINRIFLPIHRCRTVSIAHNVGSFLLSGTTPFIVTTLWQYTRSMYYVSLYPIGLLLIFTFSYAYLMNRQIFYPQKYFLES